MILTHLNTLPPEVHMPEIKPEELTLHDLIGLGTDAVNDRLPTALLIEAARRFVVIENQKRRRQEHRREERKAWGDVSPKIASRMRQAAVEAALEQTVVWADLLDVPIGQGGEGQTWGSATAEEHLFAAQRAEADGAGHVQRAAMHRRAVTDLDAGAFRTLAESTMGLR